MTDYISQQSGGMLAIFILFYTAQMLGGFIQISGLDMMADRSTLVFQEKSLS